jgi:hypothetical protein
VFTFSRVMLRGGLDGAWMGIVRRVFEGVIVGRKGGKVD